MFPAPDSLDKHVLTIRHSTDGFSYVVYNVDNQQFTNIYYHYSSNLTLKDTIKEIDGENGYGVENFRKVIILFDNSRNTFVPKDVYQGQDKDKYLGILGLTDKNSVALADFLSSAEAVNVYSITKEDFEFLSFFSGQIEYHHASSIIVASLIKANAERTDDARVYLNIKNQSFEMILMKGCKLLFDNNFRFKTKEDFLYFVLFSIEQQHLDAASVPVYFLGMIEEKSKLVETTSRYVRDIRFLSKDNDVLYKSIKCEL